MPHIIRFVAVVFQRSRHGRNAGYPAPPVQTRTCSFPASGSSVARASAQGRTAPCLLWPTGRVAHPLPVRHVRAACPCRAACFRRVLPRVGGFPHLGVLCSLRLPCRMRRAFPGTVRLRLPGACSTAVRRFQPCSVSGFPLPCLRSCRPDAAASHRQERLGLPTCFAGSLPACHGLRTPADRPNLATSVALLVPSGA